MRKIFLAVFLFLALHSSVLAQTGVSFVYVNGSNIYNPKISKWYKKGVERFHPYMKKLFELDSFANKHLLKCGQYFIEKEPVTFYWGDNDHDDFASVNKHTKAPKGLLAWIACQIRLTVISVLHDVVWIQKHDNMACVLDDLHETIKAEAQKCNKILLFGYSSGSFVTYEYLFTRIPYINVADFFHCVDIPKEHREFVEQHPMKNTCMAALARELDDFSANGHIIINKDFNSFKKGYMHLDEQTDTVCIPDNAVIGMINMASPLVLFHSDMSASDFKLTYYNRLFFKYLFENDMFWLTVNYREDPLTFPAGKNLTIKELEDLTDLKIAPCGGFIYDQSDARGGIMAITHLYYLSRRKTLAKAIIKAYMKGYSHQYCCKHALPTCKCRKIVDITP